MCNSSSSVLVLHRTSPSLLHTFVVDTLLNFPLPFNIPVILNYSNTSRVNAFGRLLIIVNIQVKRGCSLKIFISISMHKLIKYKRDKDLSTKFLCSNVSLFMKIPSLFLYEDLVMFF